ncbi:hypothetical protein ZHAS_00017080 [Anopheles sinensis]|uniref:Uncharacterized protein n=1 Tax=Anopheles sinensis TaxID=74873 RepID=A0A084WFS2_ANOSI|nr:hypothetical protein ZHAS_00017080 [Anopheles sinensis]
MSVGIAGAALRDIGAAFFSSSPAYRHPALALRFNPRCFPRAGWLRVFWAKATRRPRSNSIPPSEPSEPSPEPKPPVQKPFGGAESVRASSPSMAAPRRGQYCNCSLTRRTMSHEQHQHQPQQSQFTFALVCGCA